MQLLVRRVGAAYNTGVPSALSVENLCKEYRMGKSVVRAVDGVSLEMDAGEFVALMGASGSGKSTLLHLIGGLDVPASGTVRIAGHDLAAMGDRERTLFRRRRLGIVFQSFNLLPTLTAAENVALPLLIAGESGGKVSARSAELLQIVGLEHRAKHRPDALSGGEQQRVAIARALINDPEIILADEPTGNLDSKHAEEIWIILKTLSRDQGRTILAVTHEAAGAVHADRVIVLRDGRNMGDIIPTGDDHVGLVSTRYQELAG